jgi:hypothetical protein
MTDGTPRIDADNLYKTVLKRYFWDGMELLLPELCDAADQNVEPVSLDREMYKSIFERFYTARGREKGIEKGKFEMTKNLLARGVSPDIIADNSGLSVNEIRSMMN